MTRHILTSIRSTTFRVLLVGAALVASSALGFPAQAGPAPDTSRISGVVVLADQTPAEGVTLHFEGVDCKKKTTVSDPWHGGNVRTAEDGAFSFKAHAGQCYSVTAGLMTRWDTVPISIGKASPRTTVYLPADSSGNKLRLKARSVAITLKGAASRSYVTVYQRESGYWSEIDTLPEVRKGVVDFYAQIGARYTLLYEAGAKEKVYHQTLGGDPRSPNRADPDAITSYLVKEGKGTMKRSVRLEPKKEGAIFTPRMDLVQGQEYVVGAKVRATRPAPGWRVSYTWLSDGEWVGSGPTYKLSSSDAGSTISCRVTASKLTYKTVSRRTNSAKVLKLPSTLNVTLAQPSVSRGGQAQVTVKVGIAGVKHPKGLVRLKVGRLTLTHKLRAYDNATVIFTLPTMSPGSYQVRAEFSKSSSARPSTSQPVTLTVR